MSDHSIASSEGWRPATRYPDPCIHAIDPRFDDMRLSAASSCLLIARPWPRILRSDGFEAPTYEEDVGGPSGARTFAATAADTPVSPALVRAVRLSAGFWRDTGVLR